MGCSSLLLDNYCSSLGVLGRLSVLEDQARKRKVPQQGRLKELKDKVEALKIQRDRLVAEIEIHKVLQRRSSSALKWLSGYTAVHGKLYGVQYR